VEMSGVCVSKGWYGDMAGVEGDGGKGLFQGVPLTGKGTSTRLR